MPPEVRHLGVVSCAILVLLSGCTDWDAKGGLVAPAPSLHASAAALTDAATADASAGLTYWETTPPAGPEVTVGQADIPESDASAGDAEADAGVTADVGVDTAEQDAVLVGDAMVSPDVAAFDTLDGHDAADVDPACQGAKKALGCACASSAQCAGVAGSAGLCTLGPAGPVCSHSCAKLNCPQGWACVPPAQVCKPTPGPDVATVDAPDGSEADVLDSAGDDSSDVLVADAPGDAADVNVPPDVFTPEVVTPDVFTPEVVTPDVFTPDVFTPDVFTPDASTDVGKSDVIDFDWQGYGDANYPADADIYGGAINSCLSVYLYQQENCGKNSPSSACIDQSAKIGSLYANFLFEPLAECQKAMCVPQCAGSMDNSCMEQCVGKYCALPFLSCVANDTSGASGCAAAFDCTALYPGKLLTIASACYANATPAAQNQMAALIGCTGQPQTESCLDQIATCYAVPGASATCAQTATCMQGCGGKDTCSWKCLGQAGSQGVALLDAFWDCAVAVCKPKCGDNNKACQDDCYAKECGPQLTACLTN